MLCTNYPENFWFFDEHFDENEPRLCPEPSRNNFEHEEPVFKLSGDFYDPTWLRLAFSKPETGVDVPCRQGRAPLTAATPLRVV